MFFILSKVLLFLLSPALWIVTLLVWSFYTKKEKRKKRLRIISAVLFIVFTNPFLFNVVVRSWQPERTVLSPGKQYSAAILLGGIAMFDKNDTGYFSEDADRFIQAVKLFHSGVVQHIAVTGGAASLFKKQLPEAYHLKQELLASGIPGERIIVDSKAKNTFENAVFIKKQLDSMHLSPPYILITSALHVPRAKAVFNKAGVDVIVYPTAYKQIDSKRDLGDFIVPSVDLLTKWKFLLKEMIGLVAYRVTGKA